VTHARVRRVTFYLPPEAKDVLPQQFAFFPLAIVPDHSFEPIAGHHLTVVAHQVSEEAKLFVGEGDILAVDVDLLGVETDPNAGFCQDGR